MIITGATSSRGGKFYSNLAFPLFLEILLLYYCLSAFYGWGSSYIGWWLKVNSSSSSSYNEYFELFADFFTFFDFAVSGALIVCLLYSMTG
jgi:hypothetical protein